MMVAGLGKDQGPLFGCTASVRRKPSRGFGLLQEWEISKCQTNVCERRGFTENAAANKVEGQCKTEWRTAEG
jgi:hypothetical protein